MPEREPQKDPNQRSGLAETVVSRLLAYAKAPPYDENQKAVLSTAFQRFADKQFEGKHNPIQQKDSTVRDIPQ